MLAAVCVTLGFGLVLEWPVLRIFGALFIAMGFAAARIAAAERKK